MDPLLLIAVVLVVIALLGFGGILSAIRSAAWIIMVVAIVLFVLAYIL